VVSSFGRTIFEESNNVYWGDDKAERDMWNHSMVGYCGMAYAALALGNKDNEMNDWLKRSLPHIRNYFEVGITKEGVNREGLSYAGVTFKALAFVLKALHRIFGIDWLLHEKVNKVIEWYAYEMHPSGGRVQNFNDSYLDPRLALNGYLLLNDAIQSQIAPYVWSRLLGKRGNRSYGDDIDHWRNTLFEAYLFHPQPTRLLGDQEVPLSATRFFPEKGYVVSRTGWGEDDAVFAFTSGPGIMRIHQQSDHNSFTLFGNRTPIIMDSGPENKAVEGSRSQSIAHNCILIDGKGQALSGGKDSTSGKILWHEGTDIFDYIIGDSAPAYNQNKYNPVKRAYRHACFIKNPIPYLLLWDDIEKNDRATHNYEYVLHLANGFSIVKADSMDNRFIFFSGSTDTILSVHFLNDEEIQQQCRIYGDGNKNVDAEIRQHPMHLFSLHSRKPNLVSLLTVSPSRKLNYEFNLHKNKADSLHVNIHWFDFSFEDKIVFKTPGKKMVSDMRGHNELVFTRTTGRKK
jgi:hypothetical protein